jgi:hypothetical protein
MLDYIVKNEVISSSDTAWNVRLSESNNLWSQRETVQTKDFEIIHICLF